LRKFLIYFALLILSLAVVSAADYDISITPVKDRITLSQKAQFLVTISSNSTKVEKFSIFTPDVEWTVPPDVITVYPNTPAKYDLSVTPTKYILPGTYGTNINIRRQVPEELTTKTILINVQTDSEIRTNYRASIKADADMPITTTPDKRLSIRVTLENQNVLNITDLAIRINSDLEVLNTQRDVQLAPLEEKIVEFTYELNPLQDPGEYRVTFELLRSNSTIETFSTRILTIIEVQPPFEKVENEKLSFLKMTKELTFTSKSNIEDTQKISLPIGFLERIFTSSVPGGKVMKEEEIRSISWDLTLQPGESRTIFVTVNYRLIFYIIFLVTLFTFVYYKYRSPLQIKKEVSDVNLKEGGISEIRVMLEINNNSKKAVSHVTIFDYIPNIAEIEQSHIEGTLKPTKILTHQNKGTIVKWEIDEIAAGEDRLLSYNIRSKLSILGNFKLPRAKVKFKHRKGKEYVSYSNTIGVNP